MKKILKLTSFILAVMLLAACGASSGSSSGGSSLPDSSSSGSPSQSGSASAPATVNVLTLKGPTGVGLAQMMTDKTEGYAYTLAATPQDAMAAVVNGSADIAALPSNLAASLYAKTNGGVKMLAITTYGTLYILANGDAIQSFEDLRGKTIYTAGQGANPEYILNYLLEQNGLVPGIDVTIEFKTEHAEVATLAAEGSAEIVMLPEPNVTSAMMKNADLRIALDLTEEWNKVSEGKLAMSCFVVRSEFAEQDPEAVARFMADAKESVEFAVSDVPAAAAYCEALGIIPSAKVAEKAIPNCSFVFITGEEMKTTIQGYLQVLFDENPKSVGGAIPDDSFYFVKAQ